MDIQFKYIVYADSLESAKDSCLAAVQKTFNPLANKDIFEEVTLFIDLVEGDSAKFTFVWPYAEAQ